MQIALGNRVSTVLPRIHYRLPKKCMVNSILNVQTYFETSATRYPSQGNYQPCIYFLSLTCCLTWMFPTLAYISDFEHLQSFLIINFAFTLSSFIIFEVSMKLPLILNWRDTLKWIAFSLECKCFSSQTRADSVIAGGSHLFVCFFVW